MHIIYTYICVCVLYGDGGYALRNKCNNKLRVTFLTPSCRFNTELRPEKFCWKIIWDFSFDLLLLSKSIVATPGLEWPKWCCYFDYWSSVEKVKPIWLYSASVGVGQTTSKPGLSTWRPVGRSLVARREETGQVLATCISESSDPCPSIGKWGTWEGSNRDGKYVTKRHWATQVINSMNWVPWQQHQSGSEKSGNGFFRRLSPDWWRAELSVTAGWTISAVLPRRRFNPRDGTPARSPAFWPSSSSFSVSRRFRQSSE